MTVERFEWMQTEGAPIDAGGILHPRAKGRWVRYSDYEKLERDRDEWCGKEIAALDRIKALEARAEKAEDALAETLADRDAAYKAEDIAQRERDQARQEVLEEVLTERVFAAATAALIRERDHEGPGCGCDQCLAISALRAAVSLLATLDPSGEEGD